MVAVYAAHTLNLSPGLVGVMLSVPAATAVPGIVFGAIIRRVGLAISMRVTAFLMITSALIDLIADRAAEAQSLRVP